MRQGVWALGFDPGTMVGLVFMVELGVGRGGGRFANRPYGRWTGRGSGLILANGLSQTGLDEALSVLLVLGGAALDYLEVFFL